MNRVEYEDRVRKFLECSQCIFGFVFLMVLIPVLLISAWFFVVGV